MKRVNIYHFVILFILLILSFSSELETPNLEAVDFPVSADNDTVEESRKGYEVVKVIDGDTIDVKSDGLVSRVRLIGIDTPETVDPRTVLQCFGKEASNKAAELLSGKNVLLEGDKSQGDKDRYGRLLRYVYLEDGTSFNLLMISEGFAYEYTYSSPYRYQKEYKQAQLNAESAQKGLWSPFTCSGKTNTSALNIAPSLWNN